MKAPGLPPPAELAGLAGDEALERLLGRPDGLSPAEAEGRLARFGRKELGETGRTWLAVLAGQLRSPLLGLLVVAAAVSIGVGERVDGAIILGIMGLSIGLGFLDEFRSERTVASLRERTGRRARVLRGGRVVNIPAVEVVPGDVCMLSLGDVVPADLRLLEAEELTVDESALTGEAFPAEKQSAPAEAAAGGLLPSCVYAGSVVRSGSARGVAIATGAATRLGSVAGGLQERQPATAFQRGLGSFAGLLARVTAVLTTFIFVMNAVLGRPFLDSLLFSLAIAVGLTPQLLPAVVTVSLSTGARRLAQKGVLVKRLVSIEDLGDADVLFTDKTGTLTRGEIVLSSAVGPTGAAEPGLTAVGLLATELSLGADGDATGNPLDLALWNAAGAEARAALARERPRAVLPFTFERRRTSVLLGDGRIVCKGAAEEVLGRCSSVREGRGARPIGEVRAQVDAVLERLLAGGSRLVAVAERPAAGARLTADDERDLELLGFLAFGDPAKEDAAQSVERLRALGIELKVLTGDHEQTAEYICEQLGLPVKKVVTGADLEGLSDEELTEVVAGATIFARVGPEQKAAIVAAEQRSGNDVAFLGDGVNDAVALHRADVGISVDSAVDVAKEAADVVLLEKSLAVLGDGVVEGRRIFANTMKYVLMGTSSNFGNMFSAAGASLFLSFLPMLPSQILLNNMLYDVSELTIPTDEVDEELLRKPGHWDVGFIRRFMVFFGPISSAYDFLTFAIMLWVFHAHGALFRSGWFVESLATQALVVFVIRTRRTPFFRSRPSRPLLVVTLLVAAVGAALPYSPLGHVLGFKPLPALFFAILVAMIATYLALAELGKGYFYRHPGRAVDASGRQPIRHMRF